MAFVSIRHFLAMKVVLVNLLPIQRGPKVLESDRFAQRELLFLQLLRSTYERVKNGIKNQALEKILVGDIIYGPIVPRN